MLLFNKPLNQIDEQDLLSLIDTQRREDRFIDYKRQVYKSADTEKVDFCIDVCALANTAGGHIILGIKEQEGNPGVPEELIGFDVSPDAEKRRLEEIVRSGTEPKVSVHMEPVILPTQNNQYAFVVEVPKSWAAPHAAIEKEKRLFYLRGVAGNRVMDVSEIRSAFQISGLTIDRIRDFRLQRLEKMKNDETIIPSTSPKLILHIVPLSAFDPAIQIDLSFAPTDQELINSLRLSSGTNSDWYHNFDGFIRSFSNFQYPSHSYVQLFRNGAIEAVDTQPIASNNINPSFESVVLHRLPIFLNAQVKLGIEPPFLVMLSFLEVKGFTMGISGTILRSVRSIDRSELLPPETLVVSVVGNYPEIMRPTFNTIWNAAGWPHSLNYGYNKQTAQWTWNE